MHHRKMPSGRASLHRRQHHAIDRLMPFTGAPLFHALQLLATSDSARFHMPGHKGQPVFNSFRDVFAIDYTETYGTGNLYLGDGPIRDAEVAAARYFGANDCFFLTGGSTQGILAMLGAAVGRGGSVLIDREVHRSVCHGCALLDITPYFFSAPLLEPFGISGALRVEDAERQLIAHPDIRAVLLTSPTYYGLRRDLPDNDRPVLDDTLRQLRTFNERAVTEDFRTAFDRVHPSFFRTLERECPQLTKNDHRLCAFLLLGMSTKEIAALTFREVRSIESSRLRLRKKLNLPSGTSLYDFLNSLNSQ